MMATSGLRQILRVSQKISTRGFATSSVSSAKGYGESSNFGWYDKNEIFHYFVRHGRFFWTRHWYWKMGTWRQSQGKQCKSKNESIIDCFLQLQTFIRIPLSWTWESEERELRRTPTLFKPSTLTGWSDALAQKMIPTLNGSGCLKENPRGVSVDFGSSWSPQTPPRSISSPFK